MLTLERVVMMDVMTTMMMTRMEGGGETKDSTGHAATTGMNITGNVPRLIVPFGSST